MDMTTAGIIIFAAKSGQLVGVNGVIQRVSESGTSYEYGNHAEGAASAALLATAAMLGVDVVEPFEANPTLIPMDNGQINVFSEDGGLSAIPGYFDAKFQLVITFKNLESE
jgi:hypothetical protein